MKKEKVFLWDIFKKVSIKINETQSGYVYNHKSHTRKLKSKWQGLLFAFLRFFNLKQFCSLQYCKGCTTQLA